MTNFEAVPFWVGQWSKQRIIALSFWLWTYDLWPNVIDHSQWQKFMDKTLKKMSLTMVNDKKIVIYWKWSILPIGNRWKSFGRALSQLDRLGFQSFDPHCSLVRSRARYFSTLQFEPQVLDSWQMLVILWSLLQSGLVRPHAFQDWNGDHYIIATPLLWATSFDSFLWS